ncbi:coniferyl aldehyde dehydrogenase [Kangiella sp. TOML190]|uniref:coniferyl aldehyde dehydrogenase n=1 Tax=Kangiella sp. TOML190 TaxID=2931351 RepID=UPI00204070E1|nr:coniferyl aldehyde dehydrogenase [Kangiella sp. TOML190]
MQQTFEKLQKARRQNPFPSLAERKKWLDLLQTLVLENEIAIIEAIDKDFTGRAEFETQLAEIYPSIKAIKHAKKKLSSWMKPEKRPVSIWFKPAAAKIIYQPLGVAGIIVPWNYPLYMALGPLACAIAAGNRVMLKMSEFTPNFSQLFAELVKKYLPADVISVVNGGPDVGAEFSQLPFDHILFTGSSRVGKMVMKAASDNLTPVTLELGGKSPTIIDENFSLALAAEKIMFGKLLNSGQTCLAPDYVFVKAGQEEAFAEACKTAAQKFYPKWNAKEYSAINSSKQFQRQEAMLQDAIDKGAEIVYLNNNQETTDGRKMSPAVVLQTQAEMQIRQEEIFGPVLPIVSYQNFDEVIDYVNDHPRPLALYLFSHNQKRIKRILTETTSGGVTLNDVILHVSQESLPFGGVGNSGMGHYHGYEGFKTFSKAKSVFKQSRLAGTKLMYPPYSKLAKMLYRLMRGR